MKRLVTLSVAVVLTVATLGTAALAAPADKGPASGKGNVTIIRDEYGVPHVYGSTLQSVFYGIGWAQGQDRLWQADVFRRLGTGTSAELFGPGSIGGDIFARSLFGPPEERAAQFAAASDDLQISLEAFASGMNAWVDHADANDQLPIEYTALGLGTPRPWTVDDSLATFMFFGSFFGWFGNDELTNADALADYLTRLGPAEGSNVFADTHWLNDPDANSTAPDGGAVNPARRGKAPVPELPPATGLAADQVAAAQQAWAHTLRQAGLEKQDGSSNAIALAPRLTTDSRSLLLGGPQMGYAAPQVNHEIGIHGAGYDVTGMQIAGWPGPPIGVGSNFAWSLTSGGSDNTDMYVEVLNPNDPTQYLFEGDWQDLECRVETIGVAGAPDVDQPICRSVHGPVMGQAPGVAITLKNATFGHEIDSMDAWMSLGRARNLAEFEESLAEIWYNFNVLYADDRGNIGSWHIGRVPIRADGDNPWLPHLGTGDSEWQGFVDWSDMPHALNPDQGFLTSWNNKPAPEWSNSSAGFWLWGPVHRVNTLFNLLEEIEPGSASVETLETINRTAGFTTQQPSSNAGTVVVSTLLGDLLAEVDETADPRLSEVVDLLAAWDWLQEDEDGNDLYDSPAVAIFNTWWERAASDIFGDELGGFADSTVVGNLMYRLLHDDAALPLLADYLNGVTASDALTSALVATLDQLTIDYGSADPATWLQPIAEIVWAPTGVGTVPNTIWMNRGTYNQIVHLGPGPHLWGQNVISPGQSGDAFSPHFDDQLELYATWQYKPMRLTRADLRGHTESTERLRLP